MNLLFYEWGSYLYKDLSEIFQKNKIHFHTLLYPLKDKEQDETFEALFEKEWRSGTYDAVFSVNYFPILARLCHAHAVLYISWSYDNPLNVHNIEKTLGFPTNRVYLFDRLQAKKYQDAGFDHIYHLPLAVNTDRLDRFDVAADTQGSKDLDISFVGNLYPSALSLYTSVMDEYQKGFIEGICKAQEQVYGYYMIDDLLTDDFMASIHAQYKKANKNTSFQLPREALSYAMAANVTRKERLMLLGLLSNHFDVTLYSRERCELLQKVDFCGTCDYFTEMPVIFKRSKINLNITLKCLQSGIPLRALDILGCRGFLLSNFQPELAEHFRSGQDLVLYESVMDAYEKADYYLKHDTERERIAENGYQIVKRDFNYEDRLGILFQDVRA